MAVTYGFYNSVNHDRRYDALQMSSLFDGIIRDGVYMHYGNRFFVTPQSGMNVKVDVGRAWFNHSWTLNDNFLILPIDQSEISMKRIDTIVIEVNSIEDTTVENNRTNRIIVIKGTPSNNPVRPTLLKSDGIYQYPLADILINPGISSFSQASITNRVGTSECPYVTGPLELMDVDQLIAQWRTQWSEYVSNVQTSWNGWYSQTKSEWSEYYTNLKSEWDAYFESTDSDWQEFYRNVQNVWSETISNISTDWISFKEDRNTEFQENINNLNYDFMRWFNDLRDVLDGDVAAKLQVQILDLKEEIHAEWEGLLENSKWVNSTGTKYYQTVTAAGMKPTYKPMVKSITTYASETEKKNVQKQWGFIDYVETDVDELTFWCEFKIPTINLRFIAKGV